MKEPETISEALRLHQAGEPAKAIEAYKIALKEREELDYPPFSWLAKIEIIGNNQDEVSNLALDISRSIIPQETMLVGTLKDIQ